MPKGKSQTPLVQLSRKFNGKVWQVKGSFAIIHSLLTYYGVPGSYNLSTIRTKLLERIEEEREIAKAKLKKSLDNSHALK